VRRPGATSVLGVFLAAGFVLGLAQLFLLRFDAGDVYPAYSSLRPDPLGTKAVFEALGRVRGLPVERNFAPLGSLSGVPGTALFVLGASARELRASGPSEVQSIEAIASSGGRVVISLDDPGGAARTPKELGGQAARADGGECPGPEQKKEPETSPFGTLPGFADLEARWGFSLARAAPVGGPATETADLKAEGADLPRYVTWKKGHYFASLTPDWTTVYAHEGSPVVVERPFGEGSIVLMASSHLLSNEAMRGPGRPGEALPPPVGPRGLPAAHGAPRVEKLKPPCPARRRRRGTG